MVKMVNWLKSRKWAVTLAKKRQSNHLIFIFIFIFTFFYFVSTMFMIINNSATIHTNYNLLVHQTPIHLNCASPPQ